MEDRYEELIRKLAFCLDSCVDVLHRRAAQEKREEAGKALREITHQQRAETAEKALQEAFALLKLERNP